MSKRIAYHRWRERIAEITPANHRIGTELLLVDKTSKIMYMPNGAFRNDSITILLFESGWARIRINMKEYEIKSPGVLVIMNDVIYESIYNSPDVQTKAIIMSKEFIESISLELNKDNIAYSFFNNNPIIQTEDIVNVLNKYYELLLNIVEVPGMKFKLKSAKHLTLSMFYGYSAEKILGKEETTAKSRQEELFSRFTDILRKYYKTERTVSFYAEQMCVTPKYFSRVISEFTGHTVSYYIDDYVITEAKAMLCSTIMSIQEISNELNFPSQSVFGKYFKRITGMSPKDYRKQLSII